MYYVLSSGGQKYGPADLTALRQWASEGRVAPGTLLEDAATGRVFSAVELPGLFDGPPASANPNPYSPPPAQAGSTPYGPGSQPYSPVSNPGQPYSPVSGGNQPYSPVSGGGQAHPANVDPNTGLPLQSPYVRYDATRDFSRTNSNGQAALVLIIISFATCICTSWWSILIAVGALVCSIQAKNGGHEKGQLYQTLSIVSLVLNVISFIAGIVLTLSGALSNFR